MTRGNSRRGRVAALAVTLLAGGWLVAVGGGPVRTPPGPAGAPSAPPAPPPPLDAPASAVPGRLADGTRYNPLLYLDLGVSFGSAPTPDGTAERLLRRGAGGVEELRRLPASGLPQYLGLTVSDGMLYWVEHVLAQDGGGLSIWRAPADGAGPAVRVTGDVGAGVFYDREYDLVVADGRIHWIAVGASPEPVTEVRSVAPDGGPVAVATFEGGYRLTAWPWLVTDARRGAPVDLVDLTTGRRVGVPKSAAETAACTPVWCRVTGLPGSGVTRVDLMRPDGSQRRRIGPGSVRAATDEVAVLDRFEIVSDSDGRAARLMVYDIAAARLYRVADGVSLVFTRGGLLCWSTGEESAAQWHAVDLRAVPR
ncbi:hypothetical protein [Dactylosporangium sp. CA-092794]|uniref:hypothetical protein n=1 Tax=Dactylosporangium sp. CA-092794 TaxID=3239929 RepID=UPI003D8C2236